MIAIQTVHCPVDFSDATGRQVAVAADLCRAFGAKLVLHHNRHALGTGASVGWMWTADHHGDSRTSVEARLSDWLTGIPQGVQAESLITEGPASRAVLAVSDALNADLVVLTAHGTMADDHASITGRMLERGDRAVLVLHESAVDRRLPRFASSSVEPQVVVVSTDLTPESQPALELGFDLARTLPIDLHLVHVVPRSAARRAPEGSAVEEARRRLRALVPEALADRVQLHVEEGDPVQGIVRAARELDASCIVMAEHTRMPVRRWLSRDASQQVLHEAPCPVWYVPALTPSSSKLEARS
jgi:nucleotide-binding universal stress UspA family protein